MSMDSLELLLSLCCLPVGLAQLDLHLIEISLHLLLHSESLISAASLGLQGALQSVCHSLMITLGLLHLLVLLSQLPLDLSLHLVELELNSEDLALLVLQRALLKEKHKRSVCIFHGIGKVNSSIMINETIARSIDII